MSLFVDDLPADRRDDGPTSAVSPNALGIGQLGTDANHFSGLIAEVRLYDGAMSDVEVRATIADISSFYSNSQPTANADRYSVEEDTLIFLIPANQGVLANDTDPDGDALTATLVDAPSHGTVGLNPDGSFIYDSDANFFGQDTFTYTANDFRPSEPATVTIDVTPKYDPVIPANEEYSSLPSEVLVVDSVAGVLANDLNPDRAELTARLVDDVSAGSLQLNDDGSFSYDPMGFAGTMSFTYQVDDGTQLSRVATVTLVLNTPPEIHPDSYDITEDEAAHFSAASGVLLNDVDADGDELTVKLTTETSNGTLQLQSDGSFNYLPNTDYFGPDEFRYTISDGIAETDEAIVQLNIVSVNDPPRTQPDNYFTLPNRPLAIDAGQGLLLNDHDVDGPADLRATLVEAASHGVVDLKPDGSLTYVPNPGFSGLDSFRYRASDTEADSAIETVRIRVDAQPIRISEFMVANVDTLITRTRESVESDYARGTEEAYDWIEIQNPFDSPISIGGLYLTDNLGDLTKWQIPAGTSIDANGELLIFASGRNIYDTRLDENGLLHTSFKLSADGEDLAIAAPGGVVLFSYESYPNQRANLSYGIDSAGTSGFFLQATPGSDNSQEIRGAVADTSFSVGHGFYDQAQTIAVTTPTAGADIYYTTDGSRPAPENPTATKYSQPLAVGTTTTLRAAAFHPDLIPSIVDTQTYIFIDQVIHQGNSPAGYPTEWKNRAGNGSLPADYEMDPEITQSDRYKDIMDDALMQVPTISVVTEIDNLFDRDTGIYQNAMQSGVDWERPASVELIYPDGTVGFQVDAGLRIQGGASREAEKSPKHSFRLLFKDIYGTGKLKYPLFGTEAVDEFDTIILRAGFNQSYIHHNTFQGDNRGRAQYVRDQWAKDAQRAMGWNAPHNGYAHLYINGMYWGLYNPTERPTDDFGASYYGGEKEEYDVYNSGELLDGTADAWNRLFDLSREDMEDDANYEAIAQILDVDAYIDYMLLNHYGANLDWDDHNWYSLRHRSDEGKWYFFMWDSEFLFINDNDNTIRVSDGPRYPARIMRELSDNAEFRMRLADRIQLHMFNDGVLTPDKAVEMWNARSDQITDAIVGESARWGDYRRDVDPNSYPAGRPFVLLERDVQWAAERERLLTEYFPQRTETVIEQYRRADLFPSIDAPTFNQRGGSIDGSTDIIFQASDGVTIYYTTDGSDPRMVGGDVNPNAIEYTSPFRLTAGATVQVRGLTSDGEWSALDQAEFLFETVLASAENLRISEINYHPASPNEAEIAAGFDNDDDFEFIELVNVSGQNINLSNVRFVRVAEGNGTVGVDFDFNTGDILQLGPGENVVVVEDRDAFVFRYSSNLPIAGQWSGGLNNAAERITLVAGDQTIHEFSYSDRWQNTTDGGGFTLEHRDPSGIELALWGDASSWRASEQIGGTPGGFQIGPVPGDSNHDGIFNSSDLVLVFQAGEYEDGIAANSTFEEGDWDGDGDFTTSDLVFAFQAGTYVAAARDGTAQRSDQSLHRVKLRTDGVAHVTRAPQVQLPPDAVESIFKRNNEEADRFAARGKDKPYILESATDELP